MRRKVLSVLTAFSMVLSMLPTFAMAAGLSYDESAVGLYVEEDTEITEGVEGLVVVTAPVSVTVQDVTLTDGLVLTAEAAGANVTLAGETSVGAVVVLCEANVKVEEKAAVTAVTVAAPATVEVAGKADAVVVIETAAGAAITVTETATVAAVEVAAPNVTAEVAGVVNSLTVAETAESAAITVAETATVAAVEVAAPNVTTEVAGKVESVTVAETATGAEIVVAETAEIAAVTDATGEVTVSGEGAANVEVTPAGDAAAPAQPTPPSTTTPGTTTPSTPSVEPDDTDEPDEPSHTHSYTEEITKEATCSEDGEKTFTCSCGDTYTEVIPATNEHVVEGVTDTKKATCTEAGERVTKYSCACADVVETIPALGHDFVDGVCSRCEEKKSNTNPDDGNQPGTEDPEKAKVEIAEATLGGTDVTPTMTVRFTLSTTEGVAKVVCTVTVNGKDYIAEVEELTAATTTEVVIELYDKTAVTAAGDEATDDDTADNGTTNTPATTVTYKVTVTAYNDNNGVVSTATKDVVVSEDGAVHEHKYDETTHKCSCGETDPNYKPADPEDPDTHEHQWGDDGNCTVEGCTATKPADPEDPDTHEHQWNDEGNCTVEGCTATKPADPEDPDTHEHQWGDDGNCTVEGCTETKPADTNPDQGGAGSGSQTPDDGEDENPTTR